MSLLEYMLFRFVRFGNMSTPPRWIEDASLAFDLQNQFPGVKTVARRLWDKFRIASIYLIEKQMPSLKNGGPVQFCDVGPDLAEFGPVHRQRVRYGVYRAPDLEALSFSSRKSTKLKTLHEGKVALLLQCANPVVEDFDPAVEAPIEYYLRTGKMPTSMTDIPGVSIPSIASTFIEYLALRRIEDWAASRLSKS